MTEGDTDSSAEALARPLDELSLLGYQILGKTLEGLRETLCNQAAAAQLHRLPAVNWPLLGHPGPSLQL